MRILADQYLHGLEKWIPSSICLDRFQPSDGLPESKTDYDALLIRTVTPINCRTLQKAGRLKFIGTATAGFDHVDRDFLKESGIHFAFAAGCNANAVGLYISTSIMRWALLKEIHLDNIQVGIVGCGHTGGKVKVHLNSLGISSVEYDPPKKLREPEFHSASVEELLKCDILTFHTPLTSGPDVEYPTKHMCSNEWLNRGFRLVINAARGGVVDEGALLDSKKKGRVEDFILDVWEGEPLFSDQAATQAFIATPHIAGYSVESKLRASKMVVDQMLHFFQLKTDRSIAGDQPLEDVDKAGTDSPQRIASLFHNTGFRAVADQLWKGSNIEFYDRELRKICGKDDTVKAKLFAALRSETELRSEHI